MFGDAVLGVGAIEVDVLGVQDWTLQLMLAGACAGNTEPTALATLRDTSHIHITTTTTPRYPRTTCMRVMGV